MVAERGLRSICAASMSVAVLTGHRSVPQLSAGGIESREAARAVARIARILASPEILLLGETIAAAFGRPIFRYKALRHNTGLFRRRFVALHSTVYGS